MPADGVNVLVSGVERRNPVTQAADQRIQSLVRDTRSLIIPPDCSYKIRTAHHLSMAFVQQPEQLELLSRKGRNELLLVHPHPPRLLIHHQTSALCRTFQQWHGRIRGEEQELLRHRDRYKVAVL